MSNEVWAPPGARPEKKQVSITDKVAFFDTIRREAELGRQLQAMIVAAAAEGEPVCLGVVPQEDGREVAVYAMPQDVTEEAANDAPATH